MIPALPYLGIKPLQFIIYAEDCLILIPIRLGRHLAMDVVKLADDAAVYFSDEGAEVDVAIAGVGYQDFAQEGSAICDFSFADFDQVFDWYDS